MQECFLYVQGCFEVADVARHSADGDDVRGDDISGQSEHRRM